MGDLFDEAFKRVSSDAELRAILKTAREWGVSPRRFLGWEPTRTLGHSYENGLLVRTTEIPEVEWDDENRSLAVAYAMWLADLCPGCQRPMSETMLAENEGLYVADPAMRCHSCTAHHQASNAYSDAPTPEALFIPVTLREVVTSNAGGAADNGT